MKVLVVSAHPDDETLGCGGTLLRHSELGDEIAWVVASAAYTPVWSETVVQTKQMEKNSVADAYGVRSPVFLDFPAARLDTIPVTELMQSFSDVVEEVCPEIVYVVHGGDVHSDHRIVHQALLSVLKPPRMMKMSVRKILAYETLSSTEAGSVEESAIFTPNIYCDISDYMGRKIEIMGMYGSETQEDPMPRGASAIEALARYRGATIGVQYAEAFMLVREVT